MLLLRRLLFVIHFHLASLSEEDASSAVADVLDEICISFDTMLAMR